MGDLIRDLRLAARVLLKNPKFSVTVILTLAIGIGVNVANFSIVNAFLLRPLRYEEPNRLVHLFRVNKERGHDELRFSLPTVDDLKASSTLFEDIAAYNYFGGNLSSGDGDPEGLMVGRLTSNMFTVLGVEAASGRTFAPEDALSGTVAILSHGLWQRRFNGRADVLGESLTLDEKPITVIGVMPPDFNFPFGGVKLWVPVQPADARFDRGNRNFMPVARLREGVTRTQATAELAIHFEAIRQQHYLDDPVTTTRLTPLRQALLFLFDMVRGLMILLTVASGFVLLIICSNIANLFLVRAIQKEREVAIRSALGAGRLPLVRELLAEGLVLAIVGAALGSLLAHWAVGLAAPAIPEDLYRVGEIGIDAGVLAFSLLVSLMTVAAFALPPALQTFKTDLSLALRDASAATLGNIKARKLQNLLVVSQIALAAVLLVGTTLAVRSFSNMRDIDPGFDADRVLTMNLDLPRVAYPDKERVAGFQQELISRIEALPGVEAAGLTAPIPLNFESWGIALKIDGREQPEGEEIFANKQYVTPGYFASMGIRILEGRSFSLRDNFEAERVVVINQTFANKLWPGQSALGERIRFEQGDEERVASIVGVVADTKQMFLNDGDDKLLYLSQTQSPYRGSYLVVRAKSEPLALTASVREQIWALRSSLPVSEVRSMRRIVDESLKPWRWSAMMLSGFSFFALLLAGIGIYGVVAYTTTQRTGEIGVRMALGARPVDILRLILEKALTLAGVGVGTGAVAAFALSRGMASFLYGIHAGDPLTYILVLLTLAIIAVAAATAPALRAARIEPSRALRAD